MRVQVVIDRIGTSLALPAVTALVIAAGGDERAVAVSFAAITVIGSFAVTVAFRRLLRQAEARALRAHGYTLGRIGELFGVTRQRVGYLLGED